MKRISENLEVKKPLYPHGNSGPFYDPQHVHIHLWTTGPLKYVQKHNEPFVNKTLISGEQTYCTICHELKPSKKISTTSITSVELINKLSSEKNISQTYFENSNISTKSPINTKQFLPDQVYEKNKSSENIRSIFIKNEPIKKYIKVVDKN